MSLALSTLIYEWRRYLAAVIALSVAGLLVLAMTGLFMGRVKSGQRVLVKLLKPGEQAGARRAAQQ